MCTMAFKRLFKKPLKYSLKNNEGQILACSKGDRLLLGSCYQ